MANIRLGMIGCGGAGRGHIGRLITMPGVEIVALADPSEQNLAAARALSPYLADTPSFGTPEEMYGAVELDAVEIITPHSLHHPQTMDAVGRGVHVLCEKPLAITPEEAREIASAADSAGVVVTVSYQRRLDPVYVHMQELIERGELGAVGTIAITLGQNWAKGTAGSWRQDPATSGGGMLMDSGSHLVEVLLRLAGREVETVAAQVDNLGTPVDVNSATTIGFAGGLQGQLTIIGNLPAMWMERVVVSGTGGVLDYQTEPQHPWRTGVLSQYKDGAIVQPLSLKTPPGMDAAWLAAIRSEGENPGPPEVGVRVAELTMAIYESARTQSVVRVGSAVASG